VVKARLRQFIYDPEDTPVPQLEVGKTYNEAHVPPNRSAYFLAIPGGSVCVPVADLIRKREKPEDRLEAAAGHLAYEAEMLGQALQRARDPFAYTCWFVHFRNLWSCFRGKGHVEDEVCVQDFFDQPRGWHNIRRSIAEPSKLNHYCKAADELAAHLSYNRDRGIYQGTTPDWDLTEFILQLHEALKKHLPPERQTWFISPLRKHGAGGVYDLRFCRTTSEPNGALTTG
jgi:hypothetical protein